MCFRWFVRLLCFFFKQKTAYEMRISDWSSDVCSSDLLPLHLWLPRAYAATSPPVAALFAIMTKVGVYAIIRVVTLIFGENAGAAAWAPMPWILPCALLTMVIGFVGLLGSRALRRIAAFGVIGSTGTLLAAISVF